jgi:hypothetical protein
MFFKKCVVRLRLSFLGESHVLAHSIETLNFDRATYARPFPFFFSGAQPRQIVGLMAATIYVVSDFGTLALAFQFGFDPSCLG